jgi:hypothetical protein
MSDSTILTAQTNLQVIRQRLTLNTQKLAQNPSDAKAATEVAQAPVDYKAAAQAVKIGNENTKRLLDLLA